jgi:hypothetical protein
MKISRGALMFGIFSRLQKTEAERLDHIKALSHLIANEADHKLFDHFYQTLTILDAKSSSLLVFNGIIIAVFAVFMAETMPEVDRTAMIVGIVSILLSCFLLLLVVPVHWSSTDTLKLGKEKYSSLLLKIRNSRTLKYRWAWCCSLLAMICLCVIFFHGYPQAHKSTEISHSLAANC